MREPIPAPGPLEDPCASVLAELKATLLVKAAAEKEVHELRDVVRRLHREIAGLNGELARRPVPEDSPYGAFLASPEAEGITDPELRKALRALFDDFPVFLRPGEATWIAENSIRKEWGAYAYPNERELISFLGPERLAAEVPLDKLFKDYLWNEDYGFRLQAALTPEKRAELQAKLHGVMAKSNDPEEVAWLLERFPTFFD